MGDSRPRRTLRCFGRACISAGQRGADTNTRTHARTTEFTITANHAECNSPFPPHFSQSLLGKNHVESKRELRHDTTPRASDAFPPPGHCRDHPDAMHGKCQVTPIARLAFLDNYSGAASIKLLPIYPVQSIFCSLGHRTCLAHETLANAARTVFLATHVRSGMPSASIFQEREIFIISALRLPFRLLSLSPSLEKSLHATHTGIVYSGRSRQTFKYHFSYTLEVHFTRTAMTLGLVDLLAMDCTR